jgi:hypothetical protein
LIGELSMKYIVLRCALVAAAVCGLSASARAGDLKLSIDAGRVTIIADNVPLRQILQEWSRVGQAKIVNADKLSGPTVTLQLVNMPEKDALDILLRSASGYIAAPRAVALAGASMYDRVTILASSRAPATTMSSAAPPTFQRPPQTVDEDEPINIAMPNQMPPNPAITQYPGMPGMAPPPAAQAPALQSQPGAPMTVPRPGAMPLPQQPTVAPNPYQPTVIKPAGPGGGGPGGE